MGFSKVVGKLIWWGINELGKLGIELIWWGIKLIWWGMSKLGKLPPDMVQVRFRVDASPSLVTPDHPEWNDIGWYCECWRGGHVGPQVPPGISTFWGNTKNENGHPEIQVLYHRDLINLKEVTRFFNQAGFSLTLFSQEGEDLPEGPSQAQTTEGDAS